jgi:uncharacterized protein YjiS (DUF1127 family)
VWTPLAALWRAARDRIRQGRHAAELHGLDERMLLDLGVARAEIDALVAVRARRASSTS